MEKKQDLRVRKTYKALYNAFCELLCEKSFDDITVTELCERAETRKATFYKHFGDKYEFLVFMTSELQRRYDEENGTVFYGATTKEYYAGIFRYSLDFLERNEKMVLTVLGSAARWSIIDVISQQLEYNLKLHFKEEQKRGRLTSVNPEFLAAVFTGALVQSACWWILNKNRFSKEEVISQFTDLVMRI